MCLENDSSVSKPVCTPVTQQGSNERRSRLVGGQRLNVEFHLSVQGPQLYGTAVLTGWSTRFGYQAEMPNIM